MAPAAMYSGVSNRDIKSEPDSKLEIQEAELISDEHRWRVSKQRLLLVAWVLDDWWRADDA